MAILANNDKPTHTDNPPLFLQSKEIRAWWKIGRSIKCELLTWRDSDLLHRTPHDIVQDKGPLFSKRI